MANELRTIVDSSFVDEVNMTFNNLEILHERVINLTWSHFRTTLRVDNEIAICWHLQTTSNEMLIIAKFLGLAA